MLDLAGTDMTVADVADLASYDGVTNSSATAATLTFNIADDQSYANTIGGNVAVVKAGAGTLSLGKADRTFTGGTTVSQGKLVLAENNAKAQFDVVPNPNNGNMELFFDRFEGRTDVKVYDMRGVLIDHFQTYNGIGSSTYPYTMKFVGNGIYYFVATGKEGVLTKKVIIAQ